MIYQTHFIVRAARRGTHAITPQVQAAVRESGAVTGLANVFVHHTSASLIINENADPNVQRDLDAFLTRLVPDGDALFTHTEEGPDDMSAHVRTVLTASSLSVPISEGRLALGTWQGLYLFEHRMGQHQRKVSVTVIG